MMARMADVKIEIDTSQFEAAVERLTRSMLSVSKAMQTPPPWRPRAWYASSRREVAR